MVFFPSEIETAKGRGELVLLVDDETRVCELVCAILTDSGFRVLVASDGQQAFELFCEARDKIALVVTDVAMPHKNGPELAKEVWALNPVVPVLFCSGCSPKILKSDYDLSEKPASFLLKPYTPQELLWKVYRLLHHPDEVSLNYAGC